MGFYWYVLQISRRLFRRGIFRVYFVALLALLPQLLYLFVYVNTDGIALFSTAIIFNYWLIGIEKRWDRKSCTGLAIGVSCCALSYFNAYGFALMSVVLFVGSLIVFYGKRGAKDCVVVVLKRGLFIAGIVFLLCGWWFIRCAILYDGDFLGLSTPAKYGGEICTGRIQAFCEAVREGAGKIAGGNAEKRGRRRYGMGDDDLSQYDWLFRFF